MLQVITINKLAEKLHYSVATVRTYISRAEFSHLQFFKIGRKDVVKGITEKDLKQIKKLVNRKRGCAYIVK